MSHLSLVHPQSHHPLVQEGNCWSCTETGEKFLMRNGIPIFVPEALAVHMEEERSGLINNLKTFLRKFPRTYVWMQYTISTMCFIGKSPRAFLKEFPEDAVLLNIGSGVHRFEKNVINVDIFPYTEVDIVADATALPFAENSVDGIVCEMLIEHVPNPQKIIDEIFRVLRPGGKMCVSTPFMFPFHACPNDFYRWSSTGIHELCKVGKIKVIAARSGPTSGLVAQLVTWLAIVFSFGSTTLYNLLSVLLPLIFFPFKFLDLIIGYLPTAKHGAAAFYVIAEKR